RAARRIWSRIMQAWAATPAKSAMKLHAVTSGRMLTKRDPWVNLLRNTAACFAAGIGSVEAISVLPFTDAMGHPNVLARRLARNTQIMLQEESLIGRVTDPAGGAWGVEKQTEDFAKAGWAFLQEIEKQGGIVAALESGWLQDQIAKVRTARGASIAKRKDALIGVSEFPLLNETIPTLETPNLAAIAKSASGFAERKVEAKFAPLPSWRLAEAFEALRDRADAAMQGGKHPSVFIAALGPLAEHQARVGFSQNLLGAGGIAAVEAPLTESDLADGFKASGANVACICGSDATYADKAADAAKALKAAGAVWVLLAGKPGDSEAAWKEAGVDQFIFAGQDAVAALNTVHGALGLGK
ncbi:MAG: methylmalonyl-CoA mutase family protein, partial [Caulobacterales bacterium]